MLLLALIVAAAPPGPSAAELVARLGADDFHWRQEASEALTRLGAKACPSLMKAARSEDPEVRRRAWKLLEPHARAALARAEERRVIIKPNGKPCDVAGHVVQSQGGSAVVLVSATDGGTILRREGKEILVIASRAAFVTCSPVYSDQPGGHIRWKDKDYPLRVVFPEPTGPPPPGLFTLLAFRSDAKVTELPLATEDTRGLWCRGTCAPRKELERGVTFYEGHRVGEGIFTLRESDLSLMLAGVDDRGIAYPYHIQKFLDAYEASKKKRKGK
jgi:hypothetical protein